MGAGKWKEQFSETLRGRRISVIADKDKSGRDHAQQVAASVHGKAVGVRIVESPIGKDISDFFDGGGTKMQLLDVGDAAPAWAPASQDRAEPIADEADDDIPMTECGNAQLLVRAYGRDFRFHAARGDWLHYGNGCWRNDEDGAIVRAAKRIARSFWREAENAENPDFCVKHAKQSEKAAAIDAMLKLARSELGMTVTADQLDADPFTLNVLNGTINLRTGELRQHNPGDLLTKMAPVQDDANAKCPQWMAFLDRIMGGNQKLIDYLSRVAGLCLTGDAQEQELYIFHGSGANGKSVFLDTLAGVMGDYAAEAAPSLLTTQTHEQHPMELADLAGRRLVVASETEEGARLRVQLVKRLTGNAQIKGRFMRRDFFEFARTHKLVLVTNNRPSVRETTNAVWRRIRLGPFNVTIPKAEQDTHLLDKLRAEWPGILRWAVDGCLAWQRDGMQTPPEVMIATEKYRSEQDPLAEFLAARCILSEGVSVSRTELLSAYQQWCKAMNEPNAMDRNTFYEHVRRITGVDETMLRFNGKPNHAFVGIGLADLANEYRRTQGDVTA